MAINYQAMAVLAERLIRENGRAVTHNSRISGSYNPTTGAVTGTSEVSATIRGAFVSNIAQFIGGEATQAGDKVMLTATAVAMNDTVTDGGQTYQVISYEEIKPADVAVYYRVLLRV